MSTKTAPLVSPDNYKKRAAMLKALGHPARLLIVDELAKTGPQCVCDLTELVGSDMSTVSRHLAQLRNNGIIDDERCGTKIFYRLCFPCLGELLGCLANVCECEK